MAIHSEKYKSINNIRLHYQNVRGLRTKINKFITSSAHTIAADVLCISETWLVETISNGMIVESIFKVFRKYNDSPATQNHDRPMFFL